MSDLDLNLLLVLHMVLEEKSVAGAAKRLHVTPPAISNALARLRDALGDPLLVRRGRGLVPTPRAVELGPRLASALGEMERAVDDDAVFDPATTPRRFVLACADGDQICSVPRIAASFAAHFPLAQLHVVSIDQLTSSDGLASGTVDAAIIPSGGIAEGLHARELYVDEPVIVLREGHPVRRSRISRAQFNALGHIDVWLVLGRAGIGNRMAEEFLRRHGLERRITLIVPGFSAAAMTAAATDFAAGMPKRVAEELARGLPLRVLRLPTPRMVMPLSLAWHPRTHDDPGAVAFRTLLFDTLRKPPKNDRSVGARRRNH